MPDAAEDANGIESVARPRYNPAMNCVNCGGALPAKSAICPYCRTLNDIDLRGLFDVGRHRPDAARICPRCDQPLEAIDLGLGTPFFLDRCTKCLGLFFEEGELNAVIQSKAGQPERIDYVRLDRLLAEETPDDFTSVKYGKCPTCRKLMNRRSQGVRSGVIVDECREHGVWLDGGELRRILKWMRAGGAEHDAIREAERARQEERNRESAKMLRPEMFRGTLDTSDDNNSDIGGLVGCLIRMLLP